MKILTKCLVVGCAVGLTLTFASRASAKEAWEKCLDKTYNIARKIYDQEAKGNRKYCVKKQEGSQVACVEGEMEKAESQEAKLEDLFVSGKCAEQYPAYGLACGTATGTETGDRAQEAADAVATAIFGPGVDGLDGFGAAKKCQDKLIQRPGQAGTKQWLGMRKCAKDSHGSIGDIEACIATGLNDAKATQKFDKLREEIQKHCVDKAGFDFPVPGTENGECAGATNAIELGDCVQAQTSCENCLAMEEMICGNVDCDALSGLPGCETPRLGAHKCVLDTGSQIQIETQVLPLPPYAATGAIDITCGRVDPGTGKALCNCGVQVIDPIEISAIGYICFTPGAPCPAGEIDCDGGNALDVTMASDHNIGACTGNADCAAQCAAHCAPDAVFNSGCEGFCVGGVSDGLPCTSDTDCVDGSCPGKDTVPDGNICGCDCQAVGGAPAAAGGLLCNMPVNIDVETGAPCGDGDVLIAVGTRCLPLTTETVSTQITNANNTAAKLFPPVPAVQVGSSGTCSALATSVTTGVGLVGALKRGTSLEGPLGFRPGALFFGNAYSVHRTASL
jgi:hypothetical protein